MAAVTDYAGIVKHLLRGYAEIKPSVGEIDVELVFDDERQHYELMQCGWIGLHRVHGSVIHIDVAATRSGSSTTARTSASRSG